MLPCPFQSLAFVQMGGGVAGDRHVANAEGSGVMSCLALFLGPSSGGTGPPLPFPWPVSLRFGQRERPN